MPDEPRRLVPIARPATGQEEWQAVREPIFSGWLTQGPQVAEFERRFAARHGVDHAVATTSCTTALHLILAAMEIGPGDEVIVPAFTWVATANVVLYCGGTPVLVDVEPRTYNLDPAQLAEAITPRTKAILAVHLFGLCDDMHAIRETAGSIPVVEDAACAVGAGYRGRPAGSLGRAAAFSFHPRKSLTTGEGGMLTTNDHALAEQAVMLRNHGASVSEEVRHRGPRPYLMPEFNLLGFNYRMTDLQASIGLVQLSKLDRFLAERRQWADFYQQQLATVPWLQTPESLPGYDHGWQAFVCRIDPALAPAPREELMEALHQRGVSTRPGTHALHLLGHLRRLLQLEDTDYPVAWDCDRWTLSIPLHNQMARADYEYVVQEIKRLGC